MNRYEMDDRGFAHVREDGEWVKYTDHVENIKLINNVNNNMVRFDEEIDMVCDALINKSIKIKLTRPT